MRTVYHKSMKIFIGSQSGKVYVKVNENEFMGYDDFLSGGTALREDPRHERPYLLQVRGCFPSRFAQDEHLDSAGVLQLDQRR